MLSTSSAPGRLSPHPPGAERITAPRRALVCAADWGSGHDCVYLHVRGFQWRVARYPGECVYLLISLVLVAIADINRPFQGSVHVSDYAFRRAQMDMKE